MKNKKLYIGIDPGATTGVSFWDGETLHLDSGKFWEMNTSIKMIAMKRFPELKWCFVIEDPNLNKPVFGIKGKQGERISMSVAQRVGMNKRDAQLWIEWCEMNGYELRTVRPTKKKLDKKSFDKLTNYNLSSNQHERDAAMLVFGR